MLWRNILPLFSWSVSQKFREQQKLPNCLRIFDPEDWGNTFLRNIGKRRHIPEDGTLYNHRRENFKFNIFFSFTLLHATSCYLGLLIDPGNWSSKSLRNVEITSTKLHGITSQPLWEPQLQHFFFFHLRYFTQSPASLVYSSTLEIEVVSPSETSKLLLPNYMASHPTAVRNSNLTFFFLYATRRNALLAWCALRSWRWRQYVSTKRRSTSTKLHDITSQKKLVLLIVRTLTSNKTREIYSARILNITFLFEVLTTFPFCSWKSG
jgi:hypothetical protein